MPVFQACPDQRLSILELFTVVTVPHARVATPAVPPVSGHFSSCPDCLVADLLDPLHAAVAVLMPYLVFSPVSCLTCLHH